MNSFSNWLNNHQFKLLNDSLLKNKLPKIRYLETGSTKILKPINLNELDKNVVSEIVDLMIRLNNEDIKGLMKYKIIEINDNTLYRVMKEYKICLDDINPLEFFEENGPFDILQGILQSLICLNENKTFHGDLKPFNIFINEDNKVIISDYCNNMLYKGKEELITRRNKDLCFVCIDELLGKELDISSDIWNFGLILYYVRSGNYPFIDKNINMILTNIQWINYEEINNENYKVKEFMKKILKSGKEDRIKVDEAMIELNKLNEPELIQENENNHLPPLPFDKDEIMKMLKNHQDEAVINKLKPILTYELPRDARRLLNQILGDYSYSKKEYMQAGVYYLNAMIYSINDEDREKNNRLLGMCYIKMKDYKEAIKSFLRSFSFSKTKELKYENYVCLGGGYYGMKEYETSLKYHELALKTASDDCGKAIAKYDMSQCYFKLREDEKAFALLNEAKETVDNNYCNYLYYEIKGQFLAELKKTEESKECCETALKLLNYVDFFGKEEREEREKGIKAVLDKMKK